jgi:hypothetical protein
MGFGELDPLMSDSLPHPVRHRTFLRLADAATVIVDRLREFVPAGRSPLRCFSRGSTRPT